MLNSLIGMLVLRGFYNMVVHVQSVVVVMVVCQYLSVGHDVRQVVNSLLLTPRRKPH